MGAHSPHGGGDAEQLHRALNRSVDVVPVLKRFAVVVGRVHVEEAPAVGIETAQLFLFDSSRPHLVEQEHGSQLAPRELLFVSDVPQELDAARTIGLDVVLCVRPRNAPVDQSGREVIHSFDELI